MQRLFSMFPGSWPGAALLLLRVTAAIPLMLGGPPPGLQGLSRSWLEFAILGVGLLLLAGLWTPVAGALLGIFELWIVFTERGAPTSHYLLAVLGVSLIMLGPGAWSVDARLFGRKRIDVETR